MAQFLRAHTVLYKKLSSYPSNHVRQLTFDNSSNSRGNLMSSASTYMHLSIKHAMYMISNQIHHLVKAGNIEK